MYMLIWPVNYPVILLVVEKVLQVPFPAIQYNWKYSPHPFLHQFSTLFPCYAYPGWWCCMILSPGSSHHCRKPDATPQSPDTGWSQLGGGWPGAPSAPWSPAPWEPTSLWRWACCHPAAPQSHTEERSSRGQLGLSNWSLHDIWCATNDKTFTITVTFCSSRCIEGKSLFKKCPNYTLKELARIELSQSKFEFSRSLILFILYANSVSFTQMNTTQGVESRKGHIKKGFSIGNRTYRGHNTKHPSNWLSMDRK